MACSCCHHDDEDEREHACHCDDEAVEGEGECSSSHCCGDGCQCDGDDDDDDDDPRETLSRIIASAILLVVAMVIQHVTQLPLVAQLLLFLPSYLVAGGEVLREAG